MRMLLGLCSVDPVTNFEGVNKIIVSNMDYKHTAHGGNIH